MSHAQASKARVGSWNCVENGCECIFRWILSVSFGSILFRHSIRTLTLSNILQKIYVQIAVKNISCFSDRFHLNEYFKVTNGFSFSVFHFYFFVFCSMIITIVWAATDETNGIRVENMFENGSQWKVAMRENWCGCRRHWNSANSIDESTHSKIVRLTFQHFIQSSKATASLSDKWEKFSDPATYCRTTGIYFRRSNKNYKWMNIEIIFETWEKDNNNLRSKGIQFDEINIWK